MRTFLAIVIAAVLGLAAWLILHRATGSSPSAILPNDARFSPDHAAPTLDAPANDNSPRSAANSHSTSTGPTTTDTTLPDASTLIVHVVSKADNEPLARVRVALRVVKAETDTWENVDAMLGDIAHAPISDAKGRVEIEVPAGEPLVATASSEDKSCGMTAMDVRPLAAHERREIELHVPCGDDLRFFGRLLDRESHEPVVGASVRLMRNRDRLSFELKVHPDALLEIHTGAGGGFDLALAPWTQPYLRIEAAGYGPIVALLQPGHQAEERAQELSISREGVLRAYVLDAAEHPMANTVLVLKARGSDLQSGGDVEEPGTWMPFPDREWKVPLDDHGGCTISRLPARVPLTVEIWKDGQLLGRIGKPLQFEPGQLLERTWKIGAGARIEGRIVDQYGTPVRNHEIWLLNKDGPSEGYATAHMRESALSKSTSDGRGDFVLEDIDVGTWWIAAAPASDLQYVPGPDDVASRTQTIEVTGPGTQSVTLTVERGLLVSGHVVDPGGKPVEGTSVTCTQNGEWFPGQTRTDETGAFVVGPLGLGTCTLWADAHDEFATSDPVIAEIGKTDVVLRLHAAGSISGKVVDAATGKPCAAIVHVTPERDHSNPMSGEIETETQASGQFLIDGLEPDRYALSFATTDGRFASTSNIVVTAGKVSADVVGKVLPGAKLSIRYAGRQTGAKFTMRDGSVLLGFAQDVTADDPQQRPVPAGRITIDYTVEGKAGDHKLTVDVAVGETREVVLRDDG